jgi:NADH-quinone oxidoreductase subunit M
LNFFHWFIFWELSLIPAYFLIKLWGGENRTHAASQFFIYTLVGSVTMLLSFVAIFLASGTLDFMVLADKARTGELASLFSVKLGWYGITDPKVLALIIFSGVFLGFAVKVPLMPFHTWLPEAYSEAPPGVTIALTGAMSKMGVYGFLRILWLVIGTIVLSALAAFAQTDLRRILAYSSVNHLGYCLLGAFAMLRLDGPAASLANDKAAAADGVVLQMFNHGITASALFFFLAIIQRRSGGPLGLSDFGGLRKPAPILAGLMGIALFASLGLPGLNGFAGEFLIFKGSFSLVQWAATCSVVGLLVSAIFLLTIIQRVFNGPVPARWDKFPDLSRREILAIAPVIALIFFIGIYPQALLHFINRTAMQLVAQLVY